MFTIGGYFELEEYFEKEPLLAEDNPNRFTIFPFRLIIIYGSFIKRHKHQIGLLRKLISAMTWMIGMVFE
jgi:hypothetical protein